MHVWLMKSMVSVPLAMSYRGGDSPSRLDFAIFPCVCRLIVYSPQFNNTIITPLLPQHRFDRFIFASSQQSKHNREKTPLNEEPTADSSSSWPCSSPDFRSMKQNVQLLHVPRQPSPSREANSDRLCCMDVRSRNENRQSRR